MRSTDTRARRSFSRPRSLPRRWRPQTERARTPRGPPPNDNGRSKMAAMATDMATLCDDLLAETADLEALVAGLDADGWATPTPAAGWDVKDQVGHLAYFDDRARESMTDRDAFVTHRDEVLAHPDFADRMAAESRRFDGPDTLSWFRGARAALVDGSRRTDPSARVPWYGPDMSAASSITARIMETWAHGQDVADALGGHRAPTDRLRHVAFIGARALPNRYQAPGRRPGQFPADS